MDACSLDPAENVFVARQPIFDAKEHLWGYELLFRASRGASGAAVVDADAATSTVIADGFSLALPGVGDGARLLVNFPQNLLLSEAALALPPEICIIEILETVEPTPEVLRALAALREAGFTLALDDYMGEARLAPFLDVVGLVKVDVLGLRAEPERVAALAGMLRERKIMTLAEKVEDEAAFELTRRAGYDYFQGFHFSRPEIIPGRKISSGELSKLQLLDELGRPDFDVSRLSSILQQDPSLSYRLLRTINSAAHGLAQRVDSVRQAITLLGQKRITQWLRAVIIADLSPHRRAREIAFNSVLRGRFLQLLARKEAGLGLAPESMFLLGLFSRLDALLGMPMPEVLEHLPLAPALAEALVGDGAENGGLGGWLHLAEAYERNEWKRVLTFVRERGLDVRALNRLHTRALSWTGVMVEDGA